MGFTSFMEKKAQQQLLMRAMEAAFTAGNCIGMVIGPLSIAAEAGNATRADVELLIDDWLSAWRNVRHLSDRNLTRNRDYHTVRPNVLLSPVLLEFEQQLESIRQSPDLDGLETLAKVKTAYTGAMSNLIDFIEYAKREAALIDFDAQKYEAKAVKRGQKYWERTVREISKAMG